jgi:hypothetical protein
MPAYLFDAPPYSGLMHRLCQVENRRAELAHHIGMLSTNGYLASCKNCVQLEKKNDRLMRRCAWLEDKGETVEPQSQVKMFKRKCLHTSKVAARTVPVISHVD